MLGSGGQASVYKAKLLSDNSVVAVKVYPKHFVEDEQCAICIRSEISIMKSLKSPYVVKFIDEFLTDEGLFLIMEHIDGCSLYDVLQKQYGESESLLANKVSELEKNGTIKQLMKLKELSEYQS